LMAHPAKRALRSSQLPCNLSGNNNPCGWLKAVRKRSRHKCFIPLNPDISVLYTVGNMLDP
jgi:hypothetical protein